MQLLKLRLVSRVVPRTVLMLVVASTLLTSSSCWAQEEERRATIAVQGGMRIFNSQLDLSNDATAGLRLGLGIAPRITLLTDFGVSPANRKTGSGDVTLYALRTLARFDILSGRTRPYIVTGAGGLLFDFNDAQDYATGVLTTGYGVERRVGRRGRVTLEGDLDLYRNRTVLYGPTGQEISRSRKTTQGLGAVMLGLGFEF